MIAYTQHILFLCIIITGVIYSFYAKKLTVYGALTGSILALFLYVGTGWYGVVLMAAFFILGTLSTSHRQTQKARLFLGPIHKPTRNTLQVLANAVVPACAGLIAFLYPDLSVYMQAAIAGAFSAATADTLSSEMGNIYGSRYFNIITFAPGTRGHDGIISIEGTVFGLAGSIIISLIGSCFSTYSLAMIIIIIIAGIAGNMLDSLLGATLQKSNVLSNNGVNFFNTVTGAAVAVVLAYFV